MAGHGGIIHPTLGAAEAEFVRKARTVMLFRHRRLFFHHLVLELARFIRRAERRGATPCFRPNVYSDLPWERMPFTDVEGHRWESIFAYFGDELQAYDYTKVPGRTSTSSYHLTFSLSESNEHLASIEAARGLNVAVVFDVDPGKELPATYRGVPVIDGDASDLRFLDPPGCVVGLRAKGLARDLPSGGFVRQPDLIPIPTTLAVETA